MSESNLNNNLYQRLMSINQEAFAGQRYNVAYHALMAALHCAQDLDDSQGLAEVERVANEQSSWIDAHHPEYEHSTQSASKRNNSSIYVNAARQAHAGIRIIQHRADKQDQE